MQAQTNQTAQRTVIFDNSATSNPISIAGTGRQLSLYLDASFAGSLVSIHGKLPDGKFREITNGGNNQIYPVAEDHINRISADLSGIDEIKFVSDATETCEGTLFASA